MLKMLSYPATGRRCAERTEPCGEVPKEKENGYVSSFDTERASRDQAN